MIENNFMTIKQVKMRKSGCCLNSCSASKCRMRKESISVGVLAGDAWQDRWFGRVCHEVVNVTGRERYFHSVVNGRPRSRILRTRGASWRRTMKHRRKGTTNMLAVALERGAGSTKRVTRLMVTKLCWLLAVKTESSPRRSMSTTSNWYYGSVSD